MMPSLENKAPPEAARFCNGRGPIRRALTRLFWCASLALLLILVGCGEEISSTRLPGGAARNFLYHLQRGEVDDAMTYWAPDFTPADARSQVVAAVARLQAYETEITKTNATPNADGSQEVVLRGRVRAQNGGSWQEDQELLRARLITRGPGWRLTDFTLGCCPP